MFKGNVAKWLRNQIRNKEASKSQQKQIRGVYLPGAKQNTTQEIPGICIVKY